MSVCWETSVHLSPDVAILGPPTCQFVSGMTTLVGMRASRLLSILMTLQARGRVTAQSLADECAVALRTIYRDIDALSAAGHPLQIRYQRTYSRHRSCARMAEVAAALHRHYAD